MSSSPYGRSDVYADPSQSFAIASQASLADRLGFIRKTYFHLAGAIALFAILEFVLLNAFAAQLPTWIAGVRGVGWLVVLGVYMVVSWVAERWAKSTTSLGMQYAAWPYLPSPKRSSFCRFYISRIPILQHDYLGCGRHRHCFRRTDDCRVRKRARFFVFTDGPQLGGAGSVCVYCRCHCAAVEHFGCPVFDGHDCSGQRIHSVPYFQRRASLSN